MSKSSKAKSDVVAAPAAATVRQAPRDLIAFTDATVISSVGPNPSKGFRGRAFALYSPGMTVGSYVEALKALMISEGLKGSKGVKYVKRNYVARQIDFS